MKNFITMLALSCTALVAHAEETCAVNYYHAKIVDIQDLQQTVQFPEMTTTCDSENHCVTVVDQIKTFSSEPKFELTVKLKGELYTLETDFLPESKTVPMALKECSTKTKKPKNKPVVTT